MIQSMSYDKLHREYYKKVRQLKEARLIIVMGNKQSTYNSFESENAYYELCDKFLEETKDVEDE